MCFVYSDIMRKTTDKQHFRYQMVTFAEKHGVKPGARAFSTTTKTVRKWLYRWQEYGYAGLKDQSRAPHKPHRYITPEQRRQVIQLKKKCPSWGALRTKQIFSLCISEKAILKIWREEKLIKKKRRKHKTKNNLREIKKMWRFCQQIDLDTKDLDDIPELWPQIQTHNLPTVQYTARDVSTGLQFVSYAQERALCYSTFFVSLVIQHLASCGVDLNGCVIQSDNGSEFIGAWNAKNPSSFTKMVESVPGLLHETIPPGAHTYQADVETAHRLIEDELYEVERFSSRDNFLKKAYTYILWFNTLRKNSYKEYKSPWNLIQEKDPSINPAVVTMPPIFLDELYNTMLSYDHPRGDHVVPDPSFDPWRQI